MKTWSVSEQSASNLEVIVMKTLIFGGFNTSGTAMKREEGKNMENLDVCFWGHRTTTRSSIN